MLRILHCVLIHYMGKQEKNREYSLLGIFSHDFSQSKGTSNGSFWITVRAGAQFAVKWFLLLFQRKTDNLTIPKAYPQSFWRFEGISRDLNSSQKSLTVLLTAFFDSVRNSSFVSIHLRICPTMLPKIKN